MTPKGRGAIATIVVQGPAAMQAVRARFRGVSALPTTGFRIQQIYFGTWRSTSEEASPGEELVVCRTADDWMEVHCHGGHAAVEAIVASLQACGCVETSWTQLIRDRGQCSLNGRSLSKRQQAAVEDLAKATTERTAAILLDQYQGAVDREIEAATAAIRHGALDESQQICARLLGTAKVGLRLIQPWRVVLAGPPNVGKSSLINALVGYERAVTFNEPGTTRDVVHVGTAFHGWPIQLSDTAGLRETRDQIEQQGVLRARGQLAACDLTLFVFAVDQLNEAVVTETLRATTSGTMVVITKCDLLDQALDAPWLPAGSLQVSAHSKTGIPELIDAVCTRLVPTVPPAGAGVLFRDDQVREVEALRSLSGAP